jgi:uncharacterized protein
MAEAKSAAKSADEKLIAAATAGNCDAVRRALAEGADIHAVNARGHTSMTIAITNDDAVLAAALLDAGYPIDGPDGGTSPLMVAAGWGAMRIADLLIRRGADVNHKDNFGEDALCWALEYNYPKVAEMLLENEADPRVARSYGTVLARDPALAKTVEDFMRSSDPRMLVLKGIREGLKRDLPVSRMKLRGRTPGGGL